MRDGDGCADGRGEVRFVWQCLCFSRCDEAGKWDRFNQRAIMMTGRDAMGCFLITSSVPDSHKVEETTANRLVSPMRALRAHLSQASESPRKFRGK